MHIFTVLATALAANAASSSASGTMTADDDTSEERFVLDKRANDLGGFPPGQGILPLGGNYVLEGYDDESGSNVTIKWDTQQCSGVQPDTKIGMIKRPRQNVLENVTTRDIASDLLDIRGHGFDGKSNPGIAYKAYILRELGDFNNRANAWLDQKICPLPVAINSPPGTSRGPPVHDELRRRLLMDQDQPIPGVPATGVSSVAPEASGVMRPTEEQKDWAAIFWVPALVSTLAAAATVGYEYATSPHEANPREIGLVALTAWFSTIGGVTYGVASKRGAISPLEAGTGIVLTSAANAAFETAQRSGFRELLGSCLGNMYGGGGAIAAQCGAASVSISSAPAATSSAVAIMQQIDPGTVEEEGRPRNEDCIPIGWVQEQVRRIDRMNAPRANFRAASNVGTVRQESDHVAIQIDPESCSTSETGGNTGN